MPEAMAAPRVSNGGKNKGGAYVDRDKPAQIRFSNISAAKGEINYIKVIQTAKLRPQISPFRFFSFNLGWTRNRYSRRSQCSLTGPETSFSKVPN